VVTPHYSSLSGTGAVGNRSIEESLNIFQIVLTYFSFSLLGR
jgi:hypothetical protein